MSEIPQYYLLKVESEGRVHYVFCEAVASLNYTSRKSTADVQSPVEVQSAAEGRTHEGPLIPESELEKLFNEPVAPGKEIAAVAFPDPGGPSSPYTVFSARAQSAKNPGG